MLAVTVNGKEYRTWGEVREGANGPMVYYRGTRNGEPFGPIRFAHAGSGAVGKAIIAAALAATPTE
jgi:hypothetical protein